MKCDVADIAVSVEWGGTIASGVPAPCAGIDTACITGRMTRVSGRAGGASLDWSDGTIYPRALRTP